MKIFNTLTNTLETFKPIHKNTVNMYVCGPTVYNYIQIGNARPVIFFDVVRRYFEYKGYTVNFVSNFTDVDDKIITKAIEDETTEKVIAEKFIQAFYEDVERVGSSTKYLAPRVTEYMSSIIHYIEQLINKDFAYSIDGDVYFRVSKIKDYGILSGRKIDELQSGSRIEVNTKKENPLDFTLWKTTDVGIKYPSPWGEGRPGWHTECVAMIEDIFGGKIDIHGGGQDLMFPHHENEIAQHQALHQEVVANYWMHNGFLNIDNKKMSKSDNNYIFVKDLDTDYMGFRLFTLSTHYRAPINYTDEALKHYVTEWDKLKRTYSQAFYALDLAEYLDESVEENDDLKKIREAFETALDQDFNTANAITELQNLAKYTNQKVRQKDGFDALLASLNLFEDFFEVLGLKPGVSRMSKATRSIYMEWADARKNKDFDKADRLRDALTEKGVLS
ncbi:cysteine--tRNA ligase [Liberiplasma polymorphum]|uniref:cysteine--tRNA ligase n=1 Tax=Liberiplasma polymorphum TaxID=3374570 RepID=UPI0037728F51